MKTHVIKPGPAPAVAAVAATAAILLCLLCLLCLPAAPARADTVVVTAKQPTTLAGLEKAASASRTQMRRLEKQMKAITARYQAAQGRLDALSAELGQTRLELARAQADLDRQAELIGTRLKTMYKTGTFTWMDVLDNTASLTDLQSEMDFFRLISEQDRQNGSDLARVNAQIAQLEKDQADQREATVQVTAEIDTQRMAMKDKIAQRQAILDDLVTKIKKILARRPHDALVAPVHVTGGFTPVTWANKLLQLLGMPLTSDNLAALVAWEMAEGGHWHNTAHYNPLNTTQPMPGATAMNSVGVKAYTSWSQGFEATIITLHNGRYGGILAALRAGDDAVAVAHAVALSPWGTGNFAGLIK